jgi:hypothetical protein
MTAHKTPPPAPKPAAGTTSKPNSDEPHKDKPHEDKPREDKPIPYPGLKGTEHDPDDARDAELAALRAELEEFRRPQPDPTEDTRDPRDAAIASLKAELAAIKAQPGGEASELAKAFANLQAEVARMQAGVGLVPVPSGGEPDPFVYHARLANGDVIDLQHPNVTHWHVDGLGAVPVESVWAKTAEHLAAANADA